MPAFSLRQIEVLHAVLEHGSVGAAARALNVSQPSVSLMIRQLEDRMDLPLFERVRGRIVPTAYAEALHGLTRDLDDTVSRLRDLAMALRTGQGMVFTIGVVPALSFRVLPDVLARMGARYPGVRFDVRLVATRDVPDLLKAREIDAALHFGRMQAQPDIGTAIIGSCPLVGLAPRGADLPGRAGLADLARCRMVSVSASGPLGDMVAMALGDLGLVPDVAVTVDSYHVAASLVAAGIGTAIVDAFSVETVPAGRLEILPLPEIGTVDISATTARPSLKPDVADAFVETCRLIVKP